MTPYIGARGKEEASEASVKFCYRIRRDWNENQVAWLVFKNYLES